MLYKRKQNSLQPINHPGRICTKFRTMSRLPDTINSDKFVQSVNEFWFCGKKNFLRHSVRCTCMIPQWGIFYKFTF